MASSGTASGESAPDAGQAPLVDITQGCSGQLALTESSENDVEVLCLHIRADCTNFDRSELGRCSAQSKRWWKYIKKLVKRDLRGRNGRVTVQVFAAPKGACAGTRGY